MEYRKLGGTDLELSVVCFGTIWFAAASNRPDIDTTEGKKALHLALDCGINCIHTSYEYETRHIVREVLQERAYHDEIYQIIKVPAPNANKGVYDWKPDYFRKLVEDALDELGVERIDLLQWILRDNSTNAPEKSIPEFNSLRGELTECFEKLHREGKVGYLGVFVYEPEFAKAVAQSGCFSSLMFYYNLWDTCIFPAFDTIRDASLGVIPFRPFQGGMLTQKRADIDNLPPDDKFNTEKGRETLQTRDKLLKRACIETGNLTQTALKFILSSDLVTTIITGMNTPEQVKEICSYIDGNYPSPDIARQVYEAALSLGGPWTT